MDWAYRGILAPKRWSIGAYRRCSMNWFHEVVHGLGLQRSIGLQDVVHWVYRGSLAGGPWTGTIELVN